MDQKRIENIESLLRREQTHAAKSGAAICEECRVLRAELAGEIPDLLARIRHLEAYERGDLVPGVVVSANLAAAKRWANEESEACARICDEVARDWYDKGAPALDAAGKIRARIGNPPAETIDLRIDPEVQDTIRKASAAIDSLTAEVKMLRDREEVIGKMLPLRTEGMDVDYRVRGELTRLKILARRGWETAKAMPPIGECSAAGAADFALGQIDLNEVKS